jgi:hypothetical protein
MCAYNLNSSSRTYRYRSYCVNPCYPPSLGLAPSTVAPTSTVAPMITEASTSTVALPSTVAPTNIITSSTVALISTVASPSTKALHNSTRNTEWPLALNYNIPDAPIYALSSTSLSHLILISLLSIVTGSYCTRKQSQIVLLAPYYFIIRGISVDTAAP